MVQLPRRNDTLAAIFTHILAQRPIHRKVSQCSGQGMCKLTPSPLSTRATMAMLPSRIDGFRASC